MSSPIKNVNFDEKRPIGLEILPVGHTYVQSRQMLRTPHRALFYCILWILEGTPTHVVDFVPVPIQPGTYLFVGTGRVQVFDPVNRFKAKVLLFTDEFFRTDALAGRFLSRTPLFNTFDSTKQFMLRASPQLVELWSLLEREEKATGDRFKPLLLKNHLENFLLQSEREAGIDGQKDNRTGNQEEIFYSFKELIEEHFRDQKPVAFYLEKLRLSKKVLARTIEKLSGQTPKQLLDDRLLLEAKRLLIYDGDSGKTIGYSLGFSEPTNFIKYFKKHTGKTPLAFRDEHRIPGGA
jgi:AraC family transcriptional activator of pobA